MTDTPIVTFGCRLNLYESEAMRELATQAGLQDFVIINTCAVTGEAVRQAKQSIRKLRRERPHTLLIVTGCAAQIAPETYAVLPEVDFIIGNDVKLKAETYEALAAQTLARESVTDIANAQEADAPLVHSFSGGLTRGFVQVQNGCDHRCTYCIIPYGRGPSRSVPLPKIIEQARILLAEGYPEITLTGVDITSYGVDLPDKPTFGAMVRDLLQTLPELKRLRLSSLDPKAIDEDLWDVIASEPRLMPHLHLSLQSGDDMVLKRMKRRHTRQDVYDLVQRARSLRPEMTFGADLIAGFPTETDAMLDQTCILIEELDFTWLHVFPYSARKGTPAAKMPQVRGPLRIARAAGLRYLGEQAVKRHINRLIGQDLLVHVEQPLLARAPSFAEVKLMVPEKVGTVIRVKGMMVQGHQLLARKIEQSE